MIQYKYNIFAETKTITMIKEQTGQALRDKGMKKATDNADKEIPKWSETAYKFLLGYISETPEFMAEDVRNASSGIIDEPPSKRAWGSIFVRAVKSGFIERAGFRNVKNPKAHCTPATVWKVINIPYIHFEKLNRNQYLML